MPQEERQTKQRLIKRVWEETKESGSVIGGRSVRCRSTFWRSGLLCSVWDGQTRGRERGEGNRSLPEHDLVALYRAQHCESHKISKLQQAKWESSKSVAICTIPNCVYLWQIHTPSRDYTEKAAKWEEFTLTGTSWLVSAKKSRETEMLQDVALQQFRSSRLGF